ncbi:MAG: tetratricopeptide repeat protein [Chloroflexi bacterium]|nr:tetratricopeptide repeat protein [Chloroflexota bacterium]
MILSGKNLEFKKHNRSNPWIVMLLLFLCVMSFFLLKGVLTEQIVSPWKPTEFPTRDATSFALEAEAQFAAGNLSKAVDAYQAAAVLAPDNPEYIWKQGRALAYMTASQTTDAEKRDTLMETISILEDGLLKFTEDSNLYSVLALVYLWAADKDLIGADQVDTYMAIAEDHIRRAVDLGPRNALAYAFYSEILLQQANYERAEQMLRQALEYGVTSSEHLFDVYRVQGIVLESYGQYRSAIDAFNRALEYSPNMTFLQIRIGVNWRQLKEYTQALEMFSRAARINDQLGIKDPLPYLAIGNTYSQTGDFYAAGLNIKKALSINPYNADVYGRLGVNYYKARNYEAAIEALKCATSGCGAVDSCAVRECSDPGNPLIELTGLPLSGTSVVYYFTYVGALSYMHTDYNHYCDEAVKIAREIDAMYADDETVMGIVRQGEAICASYGIY